MFGPFWCIWIHFQLSWTRWKETWLSVRFFSHDVKPWHICCRLCLLAWLWKEEETACLHALHMCEDIILHVICTACRCVCVCVYMLACLMCSLQSPRVKIFKRPVPVPAALGSGSVSSARLDYLLLLHLQGSQNHGKGEYSFNVLVRYCSSYLGCWERVTKQI